MPEISPSLIPMLNYVRALLRTDALHDTWNRSPNQGIGPADMEAGAASLSARVAARVGQSPLEEAQAIRFLAPLTVLTREYPMVIADLAAAVRGGKITVEGIEAFMAGSEFAPRSQGVPAIPAQAPAPRVEALTRELEPV